MAAPKKSTVKPQEYDAAPGGSDAENLADDNGDVQVTPTADAQTLSAEATTVPAQEARELRIGDLAPVTLYEGPEGQVSESPFNPVSHVLVFQGDLITAPILRQINQSKES